MDKFKKTFALLGILAGLVLIIWIVNLISAKIEQSRSGAALFAKFRPEDAQQLIIAPRWNKVVLAQTAAGWVVATGDSFPADTAEINKVMTALHSMTAQDLISTNPQKYQLFQVDSIAATRVKVVAQNKDTTVDVFIGKNGSDYSSTYFRPGKGKNVYMYKQNLRFLVGKNSTTWRDTYVLRLDPESVTMLTLEFPGETVELAKGSDGAWKINQPQSSVAKQNLVNEMVNTVATLNGKSMERMNPADTSYGFNKSPCTVTVMAKNGSRYQLRLGAFNDKDKDYRIKNNFRNYVYKINDFQANTLMKRFAELRAETPAPEKKDSSFQPK